MSSVIYKSQVPSTSAVKPKVPPRDPRFDSNWNPPWKRAERPIMLNHVVYQLSRPPLNPDGLPEWALRPRGLDDGLLAYLSTGADRVWESIVGEMVNQPTSFQSTKTNQDNGGFHQIDPPGREFGEYEHPFEGQVGILRTLDENEEQPLVDADENLTEKDGAEGDDDDYEYDEDEPEEVNLSSRQALPRQSRTLSFPVSKVKRSSKTTLDDVLDIMSDEPGMRTGQQNDRSARFVEEQARLLAHFNSQNLADPGFSKDQRTNHYEASHFSKKSKTAATGNSILNNGPRLPTLKRSATADGPQTEAGSVKKFEQTLDNSARPSDQRQSARLPHRLISRTVRGKKQGKWTDEEEDILIELMRAHRREEIENCIPEKLWLKDVKLYEKIAMQLAERGVQRSNAACKNQWNRSGRAKSGFDERAANGNTRSLICSEQKPKKAKVLWQVEL